MTVGSAYVLHLDGDAGIKRAREITEQFRKALDARSAISVETAGIETADISTIQILIAARKQAQAEGKRLALARPVGKPITDFLERTGFLGQPAPASWLGSDFWSGEDADADSGKGCDQ